MAADAVNPYSDEELQEQFRRQPRHEYTLLSRDIEKMLNRWRKAKRPAPHPAARKEAQAMRERYKKIQAKDYFSADNGSRAAAGVRKLETSTADLRQEARRRSSIPAMTYRGKIWVTRPRPGIDRMASAWFIRKFVDPKARFSFAPSSARIPPTRVPFDMYGVEFGHHDSHCTLETLIERFAIEDPATVQLSQIVHDLDMKDSRHNVPECAAVARMVDGLRLLYTNDNELLAQGIILIEALHRSFASPADETDRRGFSQRRSRIPKP
jgi:hypothetical protein